MPVAIYLTTPGQDFDDLYVYLYHLDGHLCMCGTHGHRVHICVCVIVFLPSVVFEGEC